MSIFGDLFDFNGDGKTDALEEFFGLSMMNAFVLGEDEDEDDWDESDYYEDDDDNSDCDEPGEEDEYDPEELLNDAENYITSSDKQK